MFNYNDMFKSIFDDYLGASADEQNINLNVCSGVKEIGNNIYKDNENTIYIIESCLQQNSIRVIENKVDNSSRDYILTITGKKSYPLSGMVTYKIKCNKIQSDSYTYVNGVIVIKTKPRELNAK